MARFGEESLTEEHLEISFARLQNSTQDKVNSQQFQHRAVGVKRASWYDLTW